MAQDSARLARWAQTLATWAERMPLRDVYIFGGYARGDALPSSKLEVAIEYGGVASDEMMQRWKQQNAAGFSELEQALGIQITLFTDQDWDIWGPIRDAARVPLLRIGKVRVVRTFAP